MKVENQRRNQTDTGTFKFFYGGNDFENFREMKKKTLNVAIPDYNHDNVWISTN